MSGRERGLLATLCTAQVLEVLGVTVVIVALPAIGSDLQLSTAQLQLVITLYAILYGGLLLSAGRVADLVDRRLVLAAGLALSLAGALLCATAATSTSLLVGRAVQGLGGAVVTPAALSLLTSSFPSGRPRQVAMSAWTAAAAGGGALGFVVGGLLVDSTGWRGVFWLLVPLIALVLVTLWFVVPASPPRAATAGGADLAGAASVTVGLVLLVWGAGLIEQADTTIVAPAVPILLGCGLLGLFVLVEKRGRHPLIAWRELTNPGFMTANGAAFVNTATTSASGTLIALVAQRVLELDARETGFVLLPFSVLVVLGSASGGFWLRRRPTLGMAAGLGVVAVAMAALAAATVARSVLGLAVAVAVAGLGLSWAAVTSTSAATLALPDDRQGVASGAVNTAAQVGTALGVAALLSLAGLVGVDDGRTTGYTVAFLAAAGLAAAYALLLTGIGRRQH